MVLLAKIGTHDTDKSVTLQQILHRDAGVIRAKVDVSMKLVEEVKDGIERGDVAGATRAANELQGALEWIATMAHR